MTMTYEEALAYLTDLTKFGFNFGLDRITELLRRLDNPHRPGNGRPAFVHIGGTNGKGSTSIIVAQVLQAAGYRVGLFTSPHLHCYTERTRINGFPIEKAEVAKLILELKPHLDDMVKEGFEHPTEFEVWTALSLLYFYRSGVDIVVLEVGLGGAIDSTNVVLPIATCVTNVSLDHMDYLGTTVREIAQAKAGIIKPGIPVVTASDDPTVLEVLQEVANKAEAPLIRVFDNEEQSTGIHGVAWGAAAGQNSIIIRGRTGTYGPLTPPLAGEHQRTNFATAVAVLEVVRDQGFFWNDEQLGQGISLTRWPARQERIDDVLIDGAHNVAGALTLAQTLEQDYGDYRKVFVLGMLGDKEREKVVGLLAPMAEAIVVTRPNSPRAGEWADLAKDAEVHCAQVFLVEDVRGAVQQACQWVEHLKEQGEKALAVVTGSLYMVAEAREWLLERGGKVM